MKKRITIFSLAFLLVTAIGVSAFQQDKGKGNQKEQKQDKGKDQNKGNQGKDNAKNDNPGKSDQGNKGNDYRANKDNQGRGNSDNAGKGNDNRGNGNNDNDNGPGNSDRAKIKMSKNDKGRPIYVFDQETFRNRDEYFGKNKKVTICHKFNGDEPPVNINVSVNAQEAHLNHGDILGECPAINNGVFSDIFLDRRNEYYNILQRNYEQQVYSRSILDYALDRLGIYRTELATLQSSGAPASVVQSRQVAIVDLEQNVSLLERVLGVAATLAVNELVD